VNKFYGDVIRDSPGSTLSLIPYVREGVWMSSNSDSLEYVLISVLCIVAFD